MSELPIAVIGGGVAGLTAAVTLAAAGRSCVVLEASNRLGGCCASIEKDGVVFEPGASVVLGARILSGVWESLGISFEHLLSPVRPVVRVVWPDDQLDFINPMTSFCEAIAKWAPNDIPPLIRLVKELAHVYEQLPADLCRLKMGKSSERFAIIRHSRWILESYRSLIRRTISDPRLRQAFEAFSDFYAGVSASQAPAILAIMPMLSLTEGCFEVRGGIQRLPEVLGRKLNQWGGEIRCNEPVIRIVIRDGRARAVETASGSIPVSAVIATCDLRITLRIAETNLLRTARLLVRAMRPSVACAALLGVELARPTTPSIIWVLPHETGSNCDRGEWDLLPMVCVTRGPSQNGRCGFRIGGALSGKPLGGWDPLKNAIAQRLEQMVEPGSLGLDLSRSCFWGPSDYESRLWLPDGAAFGFAATRWQLSPVRYGPFTPVANLMVAGQSCFPGFGIPMAALSGRLAATALERRL